MAAVIGRELLQSRVCLRFIVKTLRNETKRLPVYSKLPPNAIFCKYFHVSSYWLKKRKTPEEKAAKTDGRNTIRYGPKGKGSQKTVDIWRNMTVADIAATVEKSMDDVFEAMTYITNAENYKTPKSVIDNPQVVKDICKICGCKYKIVPRPDEVVKEVEVDKDAVRQPPAPVENLRHRPPVITVMGHVDHGKTTLLDSLRDSNVVESEFGGITQHIGAFSVSLGSGENVTFLDTPGHAAFHAMRNRGAHVTDMVVLVVAADDGVMEQTIESIKMAKDANVPIIVAINKIDKPTADIVRTEKMLAQQGIIVENQGGEVQAVPISALKGTNLDNLVEAIALQAQIMDLKADPTGLVEGVVIEAQNDPKRGKIATVIVQRGTLRKGCVVVAGNGWAKARIMFSSDGSTLDEAPPSTPVQLLGWREIPSAGDDLIEVSSEKRAGEVMKWRHKRNLEWKQSQDLEVIKLKEAEHQAVYQAQLQHKRLIGRRFKLRPTGPRKKQYEESDEIRLNIIVKGDVDGSVEAIMDVLESYDDHERCKLDIVHYGVGNVTENDLEMAEAFNALVYVFNVECPSKLMEFVKSKGIQLKKHNIIYKMIDSLKEEINNRLPTTKEDSIIGEAEVLQPFIVTEGRKKVFVAGSRCISGTLKKKNLYKIKRGNEVVYEGKLDSMRHLKNEVESIKSNVECGLKFEDSSVEIKTGDKIICFELVDVKHQTNWKPAGF